MRTRTAFATSRGLGLVALAAACIAPSRTPALTFESGDFKGSFDSTLSIGTSWRLEDPAADLVGLVNGGTQRSVNADDGNLNYDTGPVSALIKGTHDLQLSYHQFGAFVRGAYFYDYINQSRDRERTLLDSATKRRVGARAELLDAYLSAKFDLGGMPLGLRLGSQVLSWGESTFIPNGINSINAVDASRLRAPGSEIKEALRPVPMAQISLGITGDLSLEAFYLFRHDKVALDPTGSYFSTNDFAGTGGRSVYLGFGALSDLQPLGAIPRSADRRPSGSGQGGVALRWLVPSLGDTEFGFYAMNLHSRLPVISATTPTGPINTNLTGPMTQVLVSRGATLQAAQAQAAGLWQLIVLSQTNPGALSPQQLATLQAPQTQALIAGARQIAFLTAAASGRYYTEFPKDIRTLGLSFNTNLDSLGGMALQGELSLKSGQPLQVDDVELLFAALSSLNPAFGGANNQLGSYLGQYGRDIPGYRRFDVWQAQFTATKVFPQVLGAQQLTLVAEVGGTWVPGLPDQLELRFDAPGTFTSGSPTAMASTGNASTPATPLRAFGRRVSWGYVAVAKLEYSNLFWGFNVAPLVVWTHDVQGTTPLPLGNFVQGRRSVSVGVDLLRQNSLGVELRYTAYLGGGAYNLIRDRDLASATLKYSF